MSTIINMLGRMNLGDPVTRDALTIVPLLQETNGSHQRDYISLAEALELRKAKVTEVSESGSVPSLAIHNDADVAVFILDGEELIGAKQNRIVNLSILVPAMQKLPIPVSCVERGRWSYRTREFHSSPFTMFAEGRAAQAGSLSASRRQGKMDVDQAKVWASVANRMMALGAVSPTEALHDAYESRRGALDDMLAAFKSSPGQVGAVFAVGGRAVGVELFESEEMFSRYFDRLVLSYALDALIARTRSQFHAAEAEQLLADLRAARTSKFPGVGLGDDLRIENDGLAGGALLLDDRVIHLAAFRNSKAD